MKSNLLNLETNKELFQRKSETKLLKADSFSFSFFLFLFLFPVCTIFVWFAIPVLKNKNEARNFKLGGFVFRSLSKFLFLLVLFFSGQEEKNILSSFYFLFSSSLNWAITIFPLNPSNSSFSGRTISSFLKSSKSNKLKFDCFRRE